MNTMIKKRKDFTEGPLFFRITAFALPIMLTGILQICYSMADNIVVGKFSGDPNALAASGCTGSITTLIINLLLGLSGGTGVVIAQLYGAKNDTDASRGVHTAIVTSFFGGLVFMTVGLLVSRHALMLMGTKPEILDLSTLYMRIICLGIPGNAMYNFGASILRATGDSKSPLLILSSTGIINVLLNLVFVIVFNMSVAGVAIATITAQYLSAIAVLFVLSRKEGMPCRFQFSKLCFDVRLFRKIVRYGVPSGLQSAMFSIGNIFITSSVNSFPTTTVTANTIVGNIDGLTYTAMNSFSQAAMTFTGQNYGALKPDRIKKSMLYCLIQVVSAGAIVSGIELIFKKQLISLYIDKTEASAPIIMETASELATFLLIVYIICGVMEVMSGTVKGMGYALAPMLVSICCICGIRIAWILLVFPTERFHSIIGLYITYPISWTAALIGMVVIAFFAFSSLKKMDVKKGSEAKQKQLSEIK